MLQWCKFASAILNFASNYLILLDNLSLHVLMHLLHFIMIVKTSDQPILTIIFNYFTDNLLSYNKRFSYLSNVLEITDYRH